MSDIEILEVPQGSKEWHRSRAGVITASMMHEVLQVSGGLNERQQIFVDAVFQGVSESEAAERAGYKSPPKADVVRRALDGEQVGDFTPGAHDYAFRLAVERISGEPLDEGFSTWAMQRGHELEPEARAEHAMRIGLKIQTAGFVRTSDGKFGASADGLVDDDRGLFGGEGGTEYKCFIDPAKLRRIFIGGDIEQERVQCQAGLWLTGRTWWHFCLYCPALEPADKQLLVIPMRRDEDFIEQMESTALDFDDLVEDYRRKILEHRDPLETENAK